MLAKSKEYRRRNISNLSEDYSVTKKKHYNRQERNKAVKFSDNKHSEFRFEELFLDESDDEDFIPDEEIDDDFDSDFEDPESDEKKSHDEEWSRENSSRKKNKEKRSSP